MRILNGMLSNALLVVSLHCGSHRWMESMVTGWITSFVAILPLCIVWLLLADHMNLCNTFSNEGR